MINYFVHVKCFDGNEIFCFTDEADLMNFIMDIENNVGGMSLSYSECGK